VLSPLNDEIMKNGKLLIKAEAFSSFGIKQFDFYFDDMLIGVGKKSPYEISYNVPSGIAKGVHTITVKVYDTIGNVSERKISVIAAGDLSVFLKPIVGGDFPFTLNSIVSESDVESVTFYYQIDSIYDNNMNLVEKLGPKHQIGIADRPVPGEIYLYQTLWDEDKEYFIPGKYRIFAVLENSSGDYFQSNVRYLEIK